MCAIGLSAVALGLGLGCAIVLGLCAIGLGSCAIGLGSCAPDTTGATTADAVTAHATFGTSSAAGTSRRSQHPMARRAHRRAPDGVSTATADTIAVGLGLGYSIALDSCSIALALGTTGDGSYLAQETHADPQHRGDGTWRW